MLPPRGSPVLLRSLRLFPRADVVCLNISGAFLARGMQEISETYFNPLSPAAVPRPVPPRLARDDADIGMRNARGILFNDGHIVYRDDGAGERRRRDETYLTFRSR